MGNKVGEGEGEALRRGGGEGGKKGGTVTKKPHITIANSASRELYSLNSWETKEEK